MYRIPAFHKLLVTSLVVGLAAGCGGQGCGTITPLPAEPTPTGFPFVQQIEGGIQARLTSTGFQKISSILPRMISSLLGNNLCLPQQTLFDPLLYICDVQNPSCNNQAACPITFTPLDTQVTLEDGDEPVVTVDVKFDLWLPLIVSLKNVGSCQIDVKTKHFDDPAEPKTELKARIKLSIDPVTGKLKMNLLGMQIPQLRLKFVSGCVGWLFDAINAILNILDWVQQYVGSFLTDMLIGTNPFTGQPGILVGPMNDFVQTMMPDPPGLAGVASMGTMMASMQAPKDANLEMYLVAGGYVQGYQGGLSLGVVSGINSDRDMTTRTPTTWSEPNFCVPARPAPILSEAPWLLPANTDRGDYILTGAQEFTGHPDPTVAGEMKDFAMGVSRTFLDLAGFHIYNSGTLCLTVGGAALQQLNVGTLSVLIPSLSPSIVENRSSPLMLALRPEQPLTFTIGAGTTQDPLINVHVSDLRIDFYAFIEEHYVRIFTLSVDLKVGIQLSVAVDAQGNPTIQPTISGIDKNSVQLLVSNTDMLQEDPAKLAVLIGSLIDVVVSQVAGIIQPIALPSLSGFRLKDLSISRVQTFQDDFVAIFGSIEYQEEQPLGIIGGDFPWLGRIVDTSVQLEKVSLPPVAKIREALLAGGRDESQLPSVTLNLGVAGAQDAVEWSLRIDGGAWHSWSADAHPTLVDPAFLLQARHIIEVRAREKRDPATADPTPARLEVLIDSAAPTLVPRVEGKQLMFGGRDNVSADGALRYTWRAASGWQPLAQRDSISLDEAWAASREGREMLQIAVVDEAGNRGAGEVDVAKIKMMNGNVKLSSSGGCSLSGSSSDGAAWFLLSFMGLGLLVRRWRRVRSMMGGIMPVLVFALAAAFNAGCSCNSSSASCKVNDDCRATKCTEGQIPTCKGDGTCGCVADITMGEIGRFASMSMLSGEAYVAAYNNTYGDLMIGHITPPGVISNWEFVDGVPLEEKPDNPLSKIRGGITKKGDDDGRYASIAVTSDNVPVIAYRDATHGSLKYASFGASRWDNHVVDVGTGSPLSGGDDIGRWVSLTLTSAGVPGIAYYAEVINGSSRLGQLRFAQASSASPQSTADWTISIIESRVIPPPLDGAPVDVLPNGIALFIAATRKANDGLAIAYYDRQKGNLRFVEGDAAGKVFGTPIILDGETPDGVDTGDVGQYPSIAVVGAKAYISYVDDTRHNLRLIDTVQRTPEVVDNGYRPGGEKTLDGLDAPVYHHVGASSSLQIIQDLIIIAYQDSTSEELLLTQRDPSTRLWSLRSIAGHADPFTGAYGFYAQNRIVGSQAILATYGINQHLETPLFFVETFAINIGIVQ